MPIKNGDIILPVIRRACQDVADDIAGHLHLSCRAFVRITGDTLQDQDPAETIRSVGTRLEQIHLSCRNAVTEAFDNPHEDTIVEFSLGG